MQDANDMDNLEDVTLKFNLVPVLLEDQLYTLLAIRNSITSRPVTWDILQTKLVSRQNTTPAPCFSRSMKSSIHINFHLLQRKAKQNENKISER